MKKSQIDAAFLEKQRQSLLHLRASLVAAADATESDEAEVRGDRTGGAMEFEDDAQELDALERDGTSSFATSSGSSALIAL